MEAVQLIAENVKAHDCQLHPDSVEVSDFRLGCLYVCVLFILTVSNFGCKLGFTSFWFVLNHRNQIELSMNHRS